MIEVEKKFILTEDAEKKLTTGATFVAEKTFTDSYYDNAAYDLTSRDLWLRKRDSVFELKVPMNVSLAERVSDQYEELDEESLIARHLKLPTDMPLEQSLAKNEYTPFCTITTARRKFKKDGYGIDLDLADFGYKIAEIEAMVEDPAKIAAATKAMVAYASSLGLASDDKIIGKVGEYLKRKLPAHYAALVKAGIMKG